MPSRRIARVADAVVRLSASGILLESARCSIPNLAELVAGGPIKGSWWGHKRGQDIYRILDELLDLDDVLYCRLILGKGTLVHRRLWPALHRVQEDWGRVVAKEARAPKFRALADALAQRGELRLDTFTRAAGAGTKEERRGYIEARLKLEKTLTVVSEQQHTERGEHSTVLRRWKDWVPREIERKGAGLSWVGAVDELVGAAARAARSTPKNELLEWFPWPESQTILSLERLRLGGVLRIEERQARGRAKKEEHVVVVAERSASSEVQ